MMNLPIGYITLLVIDYEQAKAWYCDALCFKLIEDTLLPNGKRWILVAPPGSVEARVLLDGCSG
jgi:lactoylglutathione lyase